MTTAKLIAEFVGTFFLVFIIGMMLLDPGGTPELAPFAIAGVLIAMIYAGYHISGAHYNPAVTIVIMIRGRCSKSDAALFTITQCLAAAAAALLAASFQLPIAVPPATLHAGPTLIAELLFTFALVYVILHVATTQEHKGNSHYGISIGLVVLAGAITVGPISFAAFNPAVSIALVIMNVIDITELWMLLLPQFAGAIAASFAFTATRNHPAAPASPSRTDTPSV